MSRLFPYTKHPQIFIWGCFVLLLIRCFAYCGSLFSLAAEQDDACADASDGSEHCGCVQSDIAAVAGSDNWLVLSPHAGVGGVALDEVDRLGIYALAVLIVPHEDVILAGRVRELADLLAVDNSLGGEVELYVFLEIGVFLDLEGELVLLALPLSVQSDSLAAVAVIDKGQLIAALVAVAGAVGLGVPAEEVVALAGDFLVGVDGDSALDGLNGGILLVREP